MYDVKPVTTAHATACGAACLCMLLAYYGHDVPLDELIQECGTSVSGCTLGDLKRVGNAHGLDGYPCKMDAEDLLRQDRPGIIHWKGTHWVVFCGLNAQEEPVICNPASGRFPLSRAAFIRFFDGYALFNGDPDDRMNSDDYFGENTPEPDYFDE